MPSRMESATDSAMTTEVDFSTICFPVWMATGKSARTPTSPTVRMAVAIMISRMVNACSRTCRGPCARHLHAALFALMYRTSSGRRSGPAMLLSRVSAGSRQPLGRRAHLGHGHHLALDLARGPQVDGAGDGVGQ